MTSKIHFICKDKEGVHPIDAKAGIYESEAWLLSAEEMAALKGGEILLHETKSTASYFGGTIMDARPVEGETQEEAGRVRWVITLQSRLDCKGVEWDPTGHTHGMAWTSGVVARKTDD